jgi:hypothetical protein
MSKEDIKKISDKSLFTGTINYFTILKINDLEVQSESILSVHIYEWIFDLIPRIDIVLNDHGAFNEKYPIVDNSIINIEYGINDYTENTTTLTFLSQSVSIENSNSGENATSIMRIVGVLENKNLLFPLISRAFSGRSSSDVIENIANEIGFTPDIRVKTIDSMTWLQTHLTNSEMIKDVVARAYLSDTDAVFCYTNRNSEMVYTSIETEVAKEGKFVAIFSSKITNALIDIPKDNKELNDGRILLFYNNIDYKSLAPIVNKEIYYGSNESHYDKNDNISTDIISDIHSLSTLSFKDKSYAGNIVHHDVYGIENNVHQNYFQTMTKNKYIKKGFFSSPLVVKFKPNKELNLFDKIDMIIMAQDGISINEVLSGQYIVGGLIQHFSKNGVYNTVAILFRNGIDKPVFDKDLELNLT